MRSTHGMFLNIALHDLAGSKISGNLPGAIDYSVGYDSLVVEDASSFRICDVNGSFVRHFQILYLITDVVYSENFQFANS